MPQIQFLYGENLKTKSLKFSSGTVYLDTVTNELFFDDPTASNNNRIKMIDTDTFLYSLEGTSLTYTSSGSEDVDLF